jgi:hypothetical protein
MNKSFTQAEMDNFALFHMIPHKHIWEEVARHERSSYYTTVEEKCTLCNRRKHHDVPIHIPIHTHHSIREYIDKGIPPGEFLYNILIQNVFVAEGVADRENRTTLSYITSYIKTLPPACWGSKEKVRDWLQNKLYKEKETEV